MKILESGRYQLSEREASEFARDAKFLEDECEKLVDLSRPLDIGELMFLKFAAVVRVCGWETAARVVTEFCEELGRKSTPN